MEVDAEPIEANHVKEEPDGGLDSDDETPRFDKHDDLYDGEADEEDAKWVAQQVCDTPTTTLPKHLPYAFAISPLL